MPVALNSPAAKVKEGRERGPSVLETLRKQEEAQELRSKHGEEVEVNCRDGGAWSGAGAHRLAEWCWCAGSWTGCEECCTGLRRQLLAWDDGTEADAARESRIAANKRDGRDRARWARFARRDAGS